MIGLIRQSYKILASLGPGPCVNLAHCLLCLGTLQQEGGAGLPDWTYGIIALEVRKGSNPKKGEHQSHVTGVSHSAFIAFELPLVGEEYRASSTRKRGTLEVISHA